MKKRLFALMLAAALVLSLPLSAHADVIFEPMDDFYESHREECDYVNRSYIANGPDGGLTLYKSPENSHVETTLHNGETVYISHVYTGPDGVSWGCAELWDDDITGWVPMAYVVPIYISVDFMEEFAGRLEKETGDLAASMGQEIWCWSHPGSGTGYNMTLDDEWNPPMYDYTFVDDAGQKWGRVGYYYGSRDFWVCLDNPTADYDTLYANHAPQQVTQPNLVSPSEVIKPGGISPAAILGAAAAVAAVSAALLVVLKKKKN